VAGAGVAELSKETLAVERPAGTPTHGTAQEAPRVPPEEQGGIPIPSAGLLQVTERRRECGPVWGPCLSPEPMLSLTPPASPWGLCQSLRSLPVPGVSACPWFPAWLQPPPVPRAGYLRSPSWTRAREQGRDKKHLSDPELPPGPPDAFLPAERPREP
ncbi:DBND1 protein, partial [Tyrannus savana]|nr:DBND1 protein [Tyrannus savana]